MWRFFDRPMTVLVLGALAATPALGAAGPAVFGIDDKTTAHRTLVKAPLPPYPAEEQGRWTQSCVALYFTVRPDGKTDQFVVLESSKPSETKFDNQAHAAQVTESLEMWRFVRPALKAAYEWQYAPAAQATEEIAVFLFERSEMGGHVMKIHARRLDLGTDPPFACTTLDPGAVRKQVAKARGGH